MKLWWAKTVAALKRVPTAVWAAGAAALAILVLLLRGRRLEAELAQAKLREQKERAKAQAAKHVGRAEVHSEAADQAAAEAAELEAELLNIERRGEQEKERIRELPPAELDREYKEHVRRARERARNRRQFDG